MVSFWWVVGAFLAGGFVALLLFVLLAMARDGESQARERDAAGHDAPEQASSAN